MSSEPGEDRTLRVKDVRKAWPRADGGRRVVLDAVSFELQAGGTLCVVGGSGSGKTTLLHILSGITAPDAGSVSLGREDLTAMSESGRDRFRARHVGYMFQTFNLVGMLSAVENVALPLVFGGASPSAAKHRAGVLLERLSMSDRADQRPAALSVGEQQRVALARAVVADPWLILADEPTASLDPRNAADALALLESEATRTGASLVIVTHDPAVRGRYARHLVVGDGS